MSRCTLVVLILRADLMLVTRPGSAESGKDKTESRSECLVSRLFNPDPDLLVREMLDWVVRERSDFVVPVSAVVAVTVVCDSSDTVSTPDEVALKVSTDTIVDKRWTPVVGAGRFGKGETGFSLSKASKRLCSTDRGLRFDGRSSNTTCTSRSTDLGSGGL